MPISPLISSTWLWYVGRPSSKARITRRWPLPTARPTPSLPFGQSSTCTCGSPTMPRRFPSSSASAITRRMGPSPRTSSINRLGVLVARRWSSAAPARQRPSAAVGTGQRSKRSRASATTPLISATAQRKAPWPARPSSSRPWAGVCNSLNVSGLHQESGAGGAGGQRCVVDVPPGNAARQGQTPAVLEFGGDGEGPAIEPGSLHPHGSERGLNLQNFPLRFDAGRRVVTAAQGAGLGEEDSRQLRELRPPAEERHQRARPVLLHLHRREIDVQAARREQALHEEAEALPRQVVDLGLHDHDLGMTGLSRPSLEEP